MSSASCEDKRNVFKENFQFFSSSLSESKLRNGLRMLHSLGGCVLFKLESFRFGIHQVELSHINVAKQSAIKKFDNFMNELYVVSQPERAELICKVQNSAASRLSQHFYNISLFIWWMKLRAMCVENRRMLAVWLINEIRYSSTLNSVNDFKKTNFHLDKQRLYDSLAQ